MPCSIKSRTSFIGIWNIWTPKWVQQVYCKKVLKSREFLCFSPLFIIIRHNKWMLLSYCEQFAILSLNVPVFQHWLKRRLVQTRCMFCRWLTSGAVNHFHLFQKINESAATQRFNGTYETSSLPLPSASSHYPFLPAKSPAHLLLLLGLFLMSGSALIAGKWRGKMEGFQHSVICLNWKELRVNPKNQGCDSVTLPGLSCHLHAIPQMSF